MGLSRLWDGARGNRAAGKAPAASCSQWKRARRGWEAATASRAPAPAPRDAPTSPSPWMCFQVPTLAVPKEGSVPLTQQRDIAMLSLPGQDGIMWPFAAGRNIWPDAAQQHRSERCHQGVNRALSTSKTSMGTDPGHLLQPERWCKQAHGKPAVPCAPKPAQEMETAPYHSRTVTELSGQASAGILRDEKPTPAIP